MCIYHQITEGNIWNAPKSHRFIGEKTEGLSERVTGITNLAGEQGPKTGLLTPRPMLFLSQEQQNMAKCSSSDSPIFSFLSLLLKYIYKKITSV